MSYSKLFKVTSDFALGFQTLNQGIDNNKALYDQVDANHYVRNPQLSNWTSPGRHDDPVIARAACDFYVNGDILMAVPLMSSGRLVYLPERIQAGQWRISVTAAQIVGVVAQVKHTITGLRHATCRVSGAGGTNGPSIVVSTWDLSIREMYDFDFSLVIWSDTLS